MFYYLVWVRTNRYHSKEPLTYSSQSEIVLGSIVNVELQRIFVPGFIVAKVSKPRFKTKPIERVYPLPPLPKEIIALASWLISYYPAPLGIVAHQFIPRDIPIKSDDRQTATLKLPNIIKPSLNSEQRLAIDQITGSGTYLLHGRTGSGKTRVYIEETLKTLKSGQSVVVLSPEIGLSSQLYDNFKEIFGNRVVRIHSRQTPKDRQTAWLRCLTSSEPIVVIGPRSALFSPVQKLGLIVIDEMHDGAYKQEQLPHYQTIRVASAYSTIAKAKLILGSATPSVSDYFLAKVKSRPILMLNKLALGPTPSSKVEVVDIKNNENFSKSSILSDPLIKAINQSLSDKEQSLIFLNRRGTSRLILCEVCGWEYLCPNCNLPLIYHGDQHMLRCHTCGHLEKTIHVVCPDCGSDSILYTSVGTKAVVDEVHKLFPAASIKRFDTDNPKADSLEMLYKSVQSGQVDILIGTQQLTKGFDLPKLSTVGILQAETSLNIPDYTSEERSFQLITQVLGRISRGHLKGRAVIQTHHPDSPLLEYAINQDYQGFYQKEIAERELFKFPPFYSLLKLSCLRASAKSAEAAASKLKATLSTISGLKIDGPAPAFHEKHQGKYQWQLVVKSTNRTNLLSVISMLPSGWTYDVDPSNLL